MGEAVGIVELYGLVAAFAAADAGCKAANVTFPRTATGISARVNFIDGKKI